MLAVLQSGHRGDWIGRRYPPLSQRYCIEVRFPTSYDAHNGFEFKFDAEKRKLISRLPVTI